MAETAVAGSSGRRYRTTEEKRRIVEQTLAPDASVSVVARSHGMNANQLFHWRKLYHAGLLEAASCKAQNCDARLLPVTVADEPEDMNAPKATPAEFRAGAIHIEFPGPVLVSDAQIAQCFAGIWPHLDEHACRLAAASKAVELGYGGIARVGRACGLSRVALTEGVEQLQAAPVPGRLRQCGHGP